MRHNNLFPLICTSLLLGGCGGSDDAGSPDVSTTVGKLNIAISDAPMSQVNRVEFVLDRLVMTDQQGVVHEHQMSQHRFNLLNYLGMSSHDVVQGLELPAGHYHDVHFTLVGGEQANGCAVENGQGRFPLMVEGKRLPLHDLTLGEQQNLFITMEIDLYQSMHFSDNQYHLTHDGIYAVNNQQMGHLVGEMDPQWIADCETTYADNAPEGGLFYHMAYLYPKEVSTIEQMADISPTTPEGKYAPLHIAPIHQNRLGDWSFAMGFVPAGEYRVAYTCLGHLDDPAENDIEQGLFRLFKDAGNVGIEDGGRQTIHQCGNGHGGHHGGHG